MRLVWIIAYYVVQAIPLVIVAAPFVLVACWFISEMWKDAGWWMFAPLGILPVGFAWIILLDWLRDKAWK